MVDRAYTDAELDAAIAALAAPERLREAQDLVMRTAPALQRVLATALEEGGWFGLGHEQAVREASGAEDPGERLRAVRTLLAEETRLGMLVGVAIGFELARELARAPNAGAAIDLPPDNTTQED
ncbi:MAG: hypothetical protein JO168_19260 [Solirubrobacterales bacterium]|nr:hypothetical protein [Solirubrobacterales bacterium]MBV9715067.1 hypothetical protein [Solirubrobacterales bacterium]